MPLRVRASLLVTVGVALLAGCGDDDAGSGGTTKPDEPRSPSAAIGAGLAPLPSELIGSWDVPGGDTVFRTTFYAQGAETCRRLSVPGADCYKVRGVRGRGAGSKEVFEWGAAGLKGGKLVIIALVAGKPSCTREPVTSSYDVTGDRLTLTSVGENCLGFRDGEVSRGRRAPRD